MVLFTSLDVKLKIWRGPTSEKCGRNSVGGHFEIGRSRNRQSGKLSFPFCYNSVVRQFRDNLG